MNWLAWTMLVLAALLWAAVALRRRFPYWHTQWYNIDVLLNGVLGGVRGETLSSRFGKAAQAGNRAALVLCRVLDLFDRGHCASSIDPHYRGQMPFALWLIAVIWTLAAVAVVAWSFGLRW